MTVATIPALTPKPAHVPQRLVRDVDLFALPGGERDVHAAWQALQESMPPIFWTPRNGGYWMVMRGKDVETVQLDHERFSMRATLIPNIPRPFPAPPQDVDPPEHAAWRRLVSPAFSPRVISEVETTVRQVAIDLIEGFQRRGECEFVSEFTKVLPIVVFLTMMQLPASDRPQLLGPADAIAGLSDPAAVRQARLDLMAYVQRAVDERRENPRDDLITKIMNSSVNGEPIPDNYVVGMCAILLSGGLDTVKNLLGFSARFLAMHPEHVAWLRAHPEKIPHAVEELIRRHGISNSARLVARDCEFLGVELKAGDMIQGASALVGLDAEIVSDPMTVDFTRPAPIRHAAFGSGPHRCPGALLAKRELEVWLQEWLPRIPEFRIKPDTVPRLTTGPANGVSELWLSWSVAG